MKKNDENQNNDSGMTRRVYKKASLDDTVVNVRKDSRMTLICFRMME